jgi:uncharacterized OsmC-like protein
MSKMVYNVTASSHAGEDSHAKTKQASVVLDTDMAGRLDAFNPAELLLAAVGACMLKSMQRIVPMIKFDMRGAQIKLHGVRQDIPPKIEGITYEIMVDTDENDQRIALLHKNIRKYGTISNTVAEATSLSGTIERAAK